MPKLTYNKRQGLFQSSGTGTFEISGNTLLGDRRKVETITASQILTSADAGKLFLIDVTTEGTDCVITLPEIDSDTLGCEYEFHIIDPSDGAGDPGGILIRTGDIANGTGDQFVGGLILAVSGASNASDAGNGRFIAPATDDSQISLDGNLADTGGEAGTRIKCIAIVDSATSNGGEWWTEGFVVTDDIDSDGTAVFINKN